MNEHPEGTPNPLNPNPEPINPEPIQPRPIESPSRSIPVEQPIPAEQPVHEPRSIEIDQPVDPMDRPMQQAPAPVEKPKKKVGLIVAVLVCLLVAVGCGVAAILLTINKNSDPVMAAMQKLMSNESPKIVAVEGDIDVRPNDDTAPYSMLSIKFNAGVNVKDNENFAGAIITAKFQNGEEFKFNADEIRTADGNLYLRLSNIAEALNNYNSLLNTTNCVDGAAGTNCLTTREVVDCDATDGSCSDVEVIMPTDTDSVLDFIGVFEVIDNEWIRIPGSLFSNLDDVSMLDEDTQCLIGAAGKLGQFSNNISDLYNKNPFITYSTENLKIVKKKDPLYRLSFNNEKFAGFINSMNNSGFMNELLACTGGQATNKNVTASDVSELTAELPVIYVEIDGSNNFTRVYLEQADADSDAVVTADMSFSYPTGITVQAPDEYIDINEVLSQLLTNFYGENVHDFTE